MSPLARRETTGGLPFNSSHVALGLVAVTSGLITVGLFQGSSPVAMQAFTTTHPIQSTTYKAATMPAPFKGIALGNKKLAFQGPKLTSHSSEAARAAKAVAVPAARPTWASTLAVALLALPMVALFRRIQQWFTIRQSAPGQEWAACAVHGHRQQPSLLPRQARYTITLSSKSTPTIEEAQINFGARPESLRIAVLGDLHLDPREMDLFHECRDHVVGHLKTAEQCHLISLGDLGGYKANPGSQECFDRASSFLDGFETDYNIVTGNHDLESVNYDSDEENLEAWKQSFKTEPYWAKEVTKNTVCIGLSTTRFRDAPGSCHEVYINDEQFDWFEQTLAKYANWNVFVFSHAPILGCGLKALQKVHIKNMCAWLNHSDRPERFIHLVNRSPQIKGWFSGHFHLSHDYVDSISVVGQCVFIQVGVMGESSQRDKRRQSRLLDILPDGYRVYTVNHHTGGETIRLDLEHKYSDPSPPVPMNAKFAAGACEQGFVACLDTGMFLATTPTEEDGCILRQDGTRECWYHMPNGALLQVVDNQLLEYDVDTQIPLGLVHLELRDRDVRIDHSTGNILLVETHADGSEEVEIIEPNPNGTYRRVFQKNKWKARLEKEAAAAKEAAAQGNATPIPY